jgi:hypothetical protein
LGSSSVRDFAGVVGERIGFAGVFDQRRIPNLQVAGRREEAGADVAVAVAVFAGSHSAVVHDENVRLAQVGDAAGMHVQLGHIRERAGQVKLKVIA